VPFGVITVKSLCGELCPKLTFRSGSTDFPLKSNNFRTALPIRVIRSSNERNSVLRAKSLKFAIRGVTYKDSRKGVLQPKCPLHNFSTVQPTYTRSNSIDQPGKWNMMGSQCQNFNLCEQFPQKNSPKIISQRKIKSIT
jgi:hypothetical protein